MSGDVEHVWTLEHDDNGSLHSDEKYLIYMRGLKIFPGTWIVPAAEMQLSWVSLEILHHHHVHFFSVWLVHPGRCQVRTNASRGRVHVWHHFLLRLRPQSCQRCKWKQDVALCNLTSASSGVRVRRFRRRSDVKTGLSKLERTVVIAQLALWRLKWSTEAFWSN